MGTLVSALGCYCSVLFDTPTGATIVCTFGAVLVCMAAAKPLFFRARKEQPITAEVKQGQIKAV
jgi:ABC-type Mn2+/Zn2+ transport system permease subunit